MSVLVRCGLLYFLFMVLHTTAKIRWGSHVFRDWSFGTFFDHRSWDRSCRPHRQQTFLCAYYLPLVLVGQNTHRNTFNVFLSPGEIWRNQGVFRPLFWRVLVCDFFLNFFFFLCFKHKSYLFFLSQGERCCKEIMAKYCTLQSRQKIGASGVIHEIITIIIIKGS